MYKNDQRTFVDLRWTIIVQRSGFPKCCSVHREQVVRDEIVIDNWKSNYGYVRFRIVIFNVISFLFGYRYTNIDR